MNRFKYVALITLLTAVASVRADTVWVGASAAKALERKNMKIEGVTADGLLFRSQSADRAAEPKPLKEIAKIQVDNEPVLNTAETAYASSKWDEAATNYQRVISTSRTEWVKHFATLRLIVAAEKSGKFSAAAGAYAALIARDPAAAESAKPEIPKGAKTELPGAINAVKTALSDAKLKPAQKDALQAFLAELYIANGQLKDAEAIGAKSPTTPAPTPTRKTENDTTPAPPPAPTINRGQADLKLQLAVAAVKQKKYQEAIDNIESVATSLTEPEQQADALFTIAEAKTGLAGKDPAKLKDAALAYMRVVAHFKNEPSAPHVSEALYKAGEVLEQAKLLPDALAAYQAVETEFKQSPHAKDAAAAALRVRKAIEDAKG
jgi:TolA-binding protein